MTVESSLLLDLSCECESRLNEKDVVVMAECVQKSGMKYKPNTPNIPTPTKKTLPIYPRIVLYIEHNSAL